MKPGYSYWIIYSFLFLIISGTASAHPHKIGKMNHGSSLTNYQVDLNFTTNDSTKNQNNSNTTFANKYTAKSNNKIDKKLENQKIKAYKKTQKTKNQKQKELYK